MILTTSILLDRYKEFGDPYGKIRRLIKNKDLFLLSKGLYTDNSNILGLYVANAIYGPSYVSFDTALSYWGMIPEAVYSVTSATTQKLKKKKYNNFIGQFTYRDVPLKAYPFGIKIIEENGYRFMIASREKALCDKLYELPVIKTQKELDFMLFNDMRLDYDSFFNLSVKDIDFLATKYHSSNVLLLAKFLRRKVDE